MYPTAVLCSECIFVYMQNKFELNRRAFFFQFNRISNAIKIERLINEDDKTARNSHVLFMDDNASIGLDCTV